MRINNPMLGMTDFSMIPSYFIDDASLLHGTSSVNMAGGGLGGLVKLSTVPAHQEGFGMQYVQGIGSFSTFDEFLQLKYGDKHWQISTRAVYQSSPNDYKYRNHDKKENIYDDKYLNYTLYQYDGKERDSFVTVYKNKQNKYYISIKHVVYTELEDWGGPNLKWNKNT